MEAVRVGPERALRAAYRSLRSAGTLSPEGAAAVLSDGICPDCLGSLVAVDFESGRTAGWCTPCHRGHSVSRRWRDDPLAPGWWYEVTTVDAAGKMTGQHGWVVPAPSRAPA